MYLPINSTQLFEAFAEKNERVLKELIPTNFNLFSIILHDPNADSEFDRQMGSNFLEWELNSEESFYLTALPEPPLSWFNFSSENREKIIKKNPNLETLFLFYRQASRSGNLDPSMMALFLAEYFGIPFRKLPAIIFTKDLSLQHFYWMPIHKKELHEQYTWLKSLASSRDPISSSKEYLRYNVQELSLTHFFNYQTFDSIVTNAKIDSKYQSYASYSRKTIPFSRRQKSKNEKEIELNLLYSGIKVLKRLKDDFMAFESQWHLRPKPIKRNNYQGEIKPPFYKNLFNLIFPNLKTDRDLISENIDFLQKESILFFEQGLNMAREIHGINQFDYSPFILPFAKSFEKELSYSLVHWVRKRFDILLPSYFYEYEPGKIAEISLGRNYSIDFNQRRNDLWVSPTLGGQLSGFKQTVTSFGNHPFNSEKDYQEFLTIAYQIKNIRNRACHSERTTKQELEKIMNCWKILFRKGYIKTLYSLKLEYMGQRTIA